MPSGSRNMFKHSPWPWLCSLEICHMLPITPPCYHYLTAFPPRFYMFLIIIFLELWIIRIPIESHTIPPSYLSWAYLRLGGSSAYASCHTCAWLDTMVPIWHSALSAIHMEYEVHANTYPWAKRLPQTYFSQRRFVSIQFIHLCEWY